MKKVVTILALLTTLPVSAGTTGEAHNGNPWFGAIGAGYAWTLLPGIDNPNPNEWDASIQGYNSSLGDRGFYTFEVGKQVQHYVDLSLMYLNHETFNYQMYQQGLSDTVGFTGSKRNRYFNLNNRALLVNGSLHPDHNWYNLYSVGFTPFIGGGVGYSLNHLDNFYTVGTIVVDGTPIGSTSSIGNQISTNSFAWQASAGVSIKPISHVSFDIGYRYYDGGNFNGSNMVYSDAQGLDPASPWSGRLSANQLFIDLKYTL